MGIVSSDNLVLAVGIGAAVLYLYRDQIFSQKPKKPRLEAPSSSKTGVSNGTGNPRDFIAKMKAGVSLRFRVSI